MRVSWNWVSEIIDGAAGKKGFLSEKVGGPKGLAALLTARGLEVEHMLEMAEGFDKVVSVQILERNKHPEADRLSLCKVSLGSGEPLDIVCGAQNMKAGDKVCLAQIGAQLPNGLKIAKSKIRGVESFGMLCSESELKLKDTSEGILILPSDTPLGRPLAEILGLDDVMLTLKLTANRGDCLSHFGLAREIAGVAGVKLEKPAGYAALGSADTWKGSPISVSLEAGREAPQFLGVYIEGVKVGPSPAWVVKRLEALGGRSINNVVDATNLVMYELGHPVHAYDADRIEGKKIGVRMATAGEMLPLLDGSEVKLAGTELVIFDGSGRSVGLAGVMGGGNSEVKDTSTRLFLECAEFDAVRVRRAATSFAKRTEAAQRFEKGVDPEGLEAAMRRLTEYILQFAGGKVVGAQAVRDASRSASTRAERVRKISFGAGYINEFLGTSFSDAEIKASLEQVGCKVAAGSTWTAEAPTYRLDLSTREELSEEVARTLGYDKIPSTVPPLSSIPELRHALTVLDRAKDAMAEAGLSETLNFSFTSQAWLKQFGMQSTAKLLNPMSEDQEVLTPSLLPGLIRGALTNWRHHFGSDSPVIRQFEIRPTFHVTGEVKAEGEMKTTVEEKWRLAFMISGPRFSGGLSNEVGQVDFFDAKAVLESLFQAMGTRGLRLQPLSGEQAKVGSLTVGQMFHPGQSAEIIAGNRPAGVVGLLHPLLARELKTRAPLWICELDWEQLAQFSRKAPDSPQFKVWGEFPPMERDFALLVKDGVTAEKITQSAVKAGKPLAKVVKVFDVYRGAQVAEGMTSVAVRVTFFDETRSLQETETEAASAAIRAAWKKDLGIELRG